MSNISELEHADRQALSEAGPVWGLVVRLILGSRRAVIASIDKNQADTDRRIDLLRDEVQKNTKLVRQMMADRQGSVLLDEAASVPDVLPELVPQRVGDWTLHDAAGWAYTGSSWTPNAENGNAYPTLIAALRDAAKIKGNKPAVAVRCNGLDVLTLKGFRTNDQMLAELRQLMQTDNLSRPKIARLAGVSKSTVDAWLSPPDSANFRPLQATHLAHIRAALGKKESA